LSTLEKQLKVADEQVIAVFICHLHVWWPQLRWNCTTQGRNRISLNIHETSFVIHAPDTVTGRASRHKGQ